ncbi:MAG: hypothetical protein WA989_11350 [Henriciella sp.]|uniref:2-keto-4-pentenoate hydratase n=1 Tax=Henriciella sp. TaxID=1968823 RepID=UPI003C769C61
MRAKAFVRARTDGLALPAYPGTKPGTLEEAYAIQDAAMDAFPDRLTGWKVGGINGDWRKTLDVTRLVGPVYSTYTHDYNGSVIDMPVFASGFAAVEGEVTAIISEDVPSRKTHFTLDDARALVASLHVGIEIASSPFPEINDHGPLVTISDFGNNRGLILGDEIPGWQALKIESWTFETRINGRVVGTSAPVGMPGGPLESVRYALENTAQRGHPMKAGMKILTGAATGVHQAYAGDEASVTLGGAHEITCKLVPFRKAD